MLRPSFIIADEPVSMLDAHVRRSFLELLGEFREQYHMTTLFITHDLSTVAYLGGEMMTMYHGDIVEKGPVEKLLLDPEHSYTKLLVASVPVPDPDKRWEDRVELVNGRPTLVGAASRSAVGPAPSSVATTGAGAAGPANAVGASSGGESVVGESVVGGNATGTNGSPDDSSGPPAPEGAPASAATAAPDSTTVPGNRGQ
jgi:hypothetical protein